MRECGLHEVRIAWTPFTNINVATSNAFEHVIVHLMLVLKVMFKYKCRISIVVQCSAFFALPFYQITSSWIFWKRTMSRGAHLQLVLNIWLLLHTQTNQTSCRQVWSVRMLVLKWECDSLASHVTTLGMYASSEVVRHVIGIITYFSFRYLEPRCQRMPTSACDNKQLNNRLGSMTIRFGNWNCLD